MYNIYKYLYAIKGISNLGEWAFVAVRICVKIHKYPSIECYWENDKLYDNIISKIMSKEYYRIRRILAPPTLSKKRL